MLDFDVTLVNYRCFAADTPVYLPMRTGMTSFVGPNNTGKSALLKLFYEMRPLFEQLRDPASPSGVGERPV